MRDVMTLRVKYADSNRYERPYLVLGEDRQLEISFDELSHNTHQYSYTVIHCNSDWKQSQLLSSDYLHGFTHADITDYDYSVNTQQLYTHYRFLIPNEDMQITASGNYTIKIYEDGDENRTVGYVCFQVVEPLVKIDCRQRANTDIELYGRYQQLDIDVSTGNLKLVNPQNDIKIVVQQNGRLDNQVYTPQPTYIEANKIRYINCKDLIFEAGNEYRHFDISSLYFMGNNVDRIHFDRSYYYAYLFTDESKAEKEYISEFDNNGGYIINAERSEDDDYEADYMFVFFSFSVQPQFLGNVYILGDLTYNQFDRSSRMEYQNNSYYGSLYLKQGGYDYSYVIKSDKEPQAISEVTEGNHWQTSNEYRIYVYYRPFGSRADRLVGIGVY